MSETLYIGKRVDNDEFVEGWHMQRPNIGKEYIVSVGNAVWYEVEPDTVEATGRIL